MLSSAVVKTWSRAYCQYNICKQTASCRQQTAGLYLSATDEATFPPDIAASMLPPHLTVPSNSSLQEGAHAKFDHHTHVEDTHSKLTPQLRSGLQVRVLCTEADQMKQKL